MISFITIGQTPRDDLLLPYEEILSLVDYQMVGVLDGMREEDIPPSTGVYPLITKLSNGTFIQVEKEYLEKKMEQLIEHIEANGSKAIVLLCAGDFDVHSNLPILQPNRIAPFYMKQFTKKKTLGVVIPISNQQTAAYSKWNHYGFMCKTLTIPMNSTSLNEEDWNEWSQDESFDMILFDCAGYSPNIIEESRKLTEKRVYGTDELLLSTLKTLLYL